MHLTTSSPPPTRFLRRRQIVSSAAFISNEARDEIGTTDTEEPLNILDAGDDNITDKKKVKENEEGKGEEDGGEEGGEEGGE
jgi:hypothetical protein